MPHIKPKIESLKNMREGFFVSATLGTPIPPTPHSDAVNLLDQTHYWLSRYLAKRWWQSKDLERQMLQLIASRIKELL